MPEGVPLAADFFARPALVVAEALIGKLLVRRKGNQVEAHRIHETEAYIGAHDLACHASRGRTPRTVVMFGPAGVWYVYFVYGMHWMLNVVTDQVDTPAAVLIRGAGAFSGPARLTKALQIDRTQNGCAASIETGLWIEDHGVRVRKSAIHKTPRIGVDYAGIWAAKPYRFVLTNPQA